jgi:integrase
MSTARQPSAVWLQMIGDYMVTLAAAGRSDPVSWLESGVHIKAVADPLGHSSISIADDVYGHTSDDTARAAVDGLTSIPGL